MMGRTFRRQNLASKLPKLKVLIACEGQTEMGYFDGIRQSLRVSKERIKVIQHKTDPLSVVNATINYRQRMKAEQAWSKDDRAWAAFDGDVMRSQADRWCEAIQLASQEEICLAITNPCLEFWYLLHFQNHTAAFNAAEAETLLKKHIPDYRENQVLYPEPLAKWTDRAIDRAEKLSQQIQQEGLDESQIPVAKGFLN